MRLWLAIAMTFGRSYAFFDEIDRECTDKSPYCNTNDCTVRPGYALEYCKKTCGDCEPFCQNSHFVSCKDSRKPECDSMLKDYCPLLCGACRPIKKKSEKKKSAKSESRTPLTFSQLLKSAVAIPTTVPEGQETTTSASETNDPSVIVRNSVQEESTVSSSMHRSPPKIEKISPNYYESAELVPDVNEYGDELNSSPSADPATALNMNHSNFVVPPDPLRVTPYPHLDFRPHPSAWQQSHADIAPPVPSFPPPSHPHFGAPQQHTQGDARRRPPSPMLFPLSPMGHPPYPYYPPGVRNPMGRFDVQPMALPDLITLLEQKWKCCCSGCRDKDPAICSRLTIESCLSRPGFYMKLCPVKCRNCNGLQCLDSVKIDCAEVRRLGGCKLPMAAEYCPRSCRLCATPPALAESLPPCKDELENCIDLAESGVCEHPYSRNTMRIYCAMSCEFCRQPQYYSNDVYRKPTTKSKFPHSSSRAGNYHG